MVRISTILVSLPLNQIIIGNSIIDEAGEKLVMAREGSLAVESFIAIPSSTEEVLVLPSTYVPRRVKHITPKNLSVASSTTSSQIQQQPQKLSPSQTTASQSTALVPFVAANLYVDPSSENASTLKENEVINSPQVSNLSVLYALPGFGSTSLMVSLIVQIQQQYPERWVSYLDLRRVANFMQKSSTEKIVNEKDWTMAKLISSYNKITAPAALQQIESFFKTTDDPESKEKKPQYLADLFLDELDEISPVMQNTILKIIANDVSKKNCPTRVWISSRSHVKSRLQTLFPEANEYELLPLSRNEQINLLANYWKITSCPNVENSKLQNFACGLHDQMEKLIPNFYKTLGACPSHLLQLPDFFTHIVTKLEEPMTENHFSTVDVSITKIFEKFVKTKFEAYVDKVSCEQPTLALSSVQFREKEFRKLERIHVKAVISSYPSFKCDSKAVFAGNGHAMEQSHELYRVGICYEENGEVKFIHKMYAEFLLAQYFVDSGRLKNTSNLYISFFLNNILFDEECKATRKFFDAYLTIQQQERRKIRDVIVWTRLRCFLIKHYRLNEEACGSASSEEEDEERNPKLTYDDIKKNGSIVHMTIMEGHFRILQMIFDCFKGFPNELKKLLSITVPLEIFIENPFARGNSNITPEIHVVDPFQMLAMYGYGSEYMVKFIGLWFQHFGDDHMKKYFEDGTWTVVHYSAMNSNCYFLHALFSENRKWEKVQVNQRNPEGQQPIHLVMTKCWYYSIKIRDHPHPDFKHCTIAATTVAATPPPSSSSSSSSTVTAIQEAIDAVSGPKSQSAPVSSSSNSGGIKRQHSGGKSSSSSSPPVSRKKCKTANPKPARRRSRTQVVKSVKDIWCFEGVEKEFVTEWDFYPEDVEWSPLRPHLLTLTLLLENGGDVNAQDDVDGQTVLHQASAFESLKAVRFLMEHGADINVRDDFERTPAQYAALNGNMEVLEVFAGQGQQDNRRFGSVSELLNGGKDSSMICNIC